jgi:hypothetical protein
LPSFNGSFVCWKTILDLLEPVDDINYLLIRGLARPISSSLPVVLQYQSLEYALESSHVVCSN